MACIATSPLTGSGFSVLQNNFANVSYTLGKMGGKAIQRRTHKGLRKEAFFAIKTKTSGISLALDKRDQVSISFCNGQAVHRRQLQANFTVISFGEQNDTLPILGRIL